MLSIISRGCVLEIDVCVLPVLLQRLCLGNRRMSAASIAAEVEGVGGKLHAKEV